MTTEASIVFLRCRDLEATTRFYSGMVGLPIALDQGGCRIFGTGGTGYFGFCKGEPTEPAASVCLTLVVADVPGWHQRLVGAGACPDGPPRINDQYRIEHFFVNDPDGYRLEVQRFLDPGWSQV
jgi:catechol 2,3-dioxygenase-like lactoylglutathione lyase family enzyme